LKKYLWILPVAIAICIYSVAFDNFFVYDDFIWLYRAKTLGENWSRMFSPDLLYFDPIVYLMFLADFFIAGLDPRWYHSVDIVIHAICALLVFRFATLLSEDEKAGLYGSLLFASSFAIADAVLWPSSRVDLVSVMFSLGTLILFLRYLRTDNGRFLCLSCLMFVLALGAKGTPVVMPFILLWLLFMEKKLRRFVAVVPFALLVILYFALLKMALVSTASSIPELHFNPRNISLAISTLIIPERQLASLNPNVIALLLTLSITALGICRFTPTAPTRLCRTGTFILAAAVLPVLVLRDLKLAIAENAINLLSSPSHRIYFAAVGFALIGGGVLRSLELLMKRYSSKGAPFVITLFLAGIISFNFLEVRGRDLLWQLEGVKILSGLDGLLENQEKIVEDGFVGLVDFPGSRGFLTPMIKVYFDLNKVITEKYVQVGEITDPEILNRAERSTFFVWGKDFKVYDLSDQFKNLLLVCKEANSKPATPGHIFEINRISTELNRNIDMLLP